MQNPLGVVVPNSTCSALGIPADPGDLELLKSILGTSAQRCSQIEELLAGRDLWSLSRLDARGYRELGLAPVAAGRLSAAFTLSRRMAAYRRPRRPCLNSPERVFRCLEDALIGMQKEHFFALLLDGKHRMFRCECVSVGTLTASLVHPREFFCSAVRESAAAVIAVHNHPSGDPEPSREDREVTRRLADAGKLLGIPLLDHVVIADRSFVSLKERQAF